MTHDTLTPMMRVAKKSKFQETIALATLKILKGIVLQAIKVLVLV